MKYAQVIRTAVAASLIASFSGFAAMAEEDTAPAPVKESAAKSTLAAAYECDRMATRPLDISSPSKGVAFDDIDAEPAIRACREASRKFPTTGRFFTQLGRALLKVKRLGQAGRALKKAEELSHPPALDIIGYMYENGFSVVRNAPKAREYYRRAAEPGDAFGQYNLGRVYLKGIGGEERREEGLALLKKAAEKGVPEAMYLIGDTERTASGGDLQKALAWYRKAAQNNHLKSQNLLGQVYGEGGKVPANPEEAFKWTQKAADRGSAEAQTRLGLFYLSGTGAEKDKATGAEWLEKASKQDFGRAHAELGVLYAEGRGVKQDYHQALRLFRLGMNAKEPKAYYHMGLMYESGFGVVESAERARQYYKYAADLGDKLASAKLEEAARSVSVAAVKAAEDAKPDGEPAKAEDAPDAAKPAGQETAKAESGAPEAEQAMKPKLAAAPASEPKGKPEADKAAEAKAEPAKTAGEKVAQAEPLAADPVAAAKMRLSRLGLIGTLD